jgi:hypothetical protein
LRPHCARGVPVGRWAPPESGPIMPVAYIPRERSADCVSALPAGKQEDRWLDCVVNEIRSSKSRQRAGHPARFPTRLTFRRRDTSSNFSRLAAKNRPNHWPFRSFAIRACQLSALESIFDPLLAVSLPFAEQERASDAARDAVVPACQGDIDQLSASHGHWWISVQDPHTVQNGISIVKKRLGFFR